MRGPFRIEDANGAEITPQLRKSRGLIALLATSENHYRTRAWIQNKLWSDRAPEQAASSLRQSLADIRRHLGDLRDIVIADRTGVALNPDAVELIDMPNGTDTTARLFEGLGIRDTAFEGWLAELRARDPVAQRHLKNGAELHAPQGVKRFDQPLRQIVFHAENETGGQLGFIETALIELTVRSLREQTDVEVYFNPPDMLRADAIMVEVQCYPLSGGAFGLRSSVQAVANGDMQWTGAARIEAAPDAGQTPASLSVASAQLANGVLSSLVRPHQSAPAHEDMDANLLALLGMQKVFTLRAEEAALAGRLLNEAHQRRPRAVYLAWLAQLNTIEFIEGLRPRDDTEAAADERIAKAFESDPNNSQVLTVAANCAMVYKRNAQVAGHLAQQAVAANPANAMAWWVLAHIQLYNGQHEDSYQSSLRGQRLAHGTNLQYWLDFQRSIAAAFCGRMDEAQLLCQSTATLRPEFRAALRFSVMLHATADQTDLGAQMVRRLQGLEDGFSTERFVLDGDYPVGLFRKIPGYSPEKLMKLHA